MHRGTVTAVDAAGIYVRLARFGVVGPMLWVGQYPSAGDNVMVADVGGADEPDMVVVGKVPSERGPIKAAYKPSDGVFTAASDSNTILYLMPHGSGYVRVRAFVSSGTVATPTVVGANRTFLELDARGWTPTTSYKRAASVTLGTATGTFSDTSMPGRIVLSTTPDGSTTLQSRLTVQSTGTITVGAVGDSAGIELGTSGPRIMSGAGSPESVVTGPVGSLWLRTDGSTSTTLYVKTSGTGNTGWTAK